MIPSSLCACVCHPSDWGRKRVFSFLFLFSFFKNRFLFLPTFVLYEGVGLDLLWVNKLLVGDLFLAQLN